MRGFIFASNFTKLYVTGDNGASNDIIYEYSLACAGTITCDPLMIKILKQSLKQMLNYQNV